MTDNRSISYDKRVFYDSDDKEIYLRGEYSEFKIHQRTGKVEDKGKFIGNVEYTEVVDLVENRTYDFIGAKQLEYKNDIGKISVYREEPLPIRIVVDVEKGKSTYAISIDSLLKDQVDFRTDKFKIIEICDARGGRAEIRGNDVVFTVENNYKGLMSFRFIFENEFGQAVAEKVPVLLRTPDLPKDQKFWQQWYLEYINVIPVWNKYTGKGVTVAVYDTAFFPRHADIDNNVIYREKLSNYDYQSEIKLSQHGLQVASVIAAERNNDFYVGVAYEAKIASYQALGLGKRHLIELDFFKKYDVINNSWGMSVPFIFDLSNEKYIKGFRDAVNEGRNGLGRTIIFASGNSGVFGVDANGDWVTHSSYTIIVGGINKPHNLLFMEKETEYFATHGANILVSAPASNICLLSGGDFSISEDIQSKDSNVINTAGTSFAAPIVSGVVALMLEANPKLGYRDVQEILAASAIAEYQGLLPQWQWENNKAVTWNGAGYHFSNQYGFGKVDANGATKLARSWPLQQTIKNLKTAKGDYQITKYKVIKESLYEIEIPQNIIAEHVEQYFNIRITQGTLQDVNLYLQSPSGTISKLLYKFLHLPVNNQKLQIPMMAAVFGKVYAAEEMKWNFGSTHFRGEESKGKWTVKVEITESEAKTEVVVSELSIKIYGKSKNASKQMIYTDEFSSRIKNIMNMQGQEAGLKGVLSVEEKNLFDRDLALATRYMNKMLNISSEQDIDIINTAALSSKICLDFSTSELEIDHNKIKIDQSVALKRVIATDYDDEFIISNNQNIIIVANEGNDKFSFSGSNNVITIKKYTGDLIIDNFKVNKDSNLFGFDDDALQAVGSHFVIHVDNLLEDLCSWYNWEFRDDANNVIKLDFCKDSDYY